MNCSGINTELNRQYVYLSYQIFTSIQLNLTLSDINIFKHETNNFNSVALSLLNNLTNMKNGKYFQKYKEIIRLLLCPIFRFGNICYDKFIQSKLHEIDKVESNSVWRAPDETTILKCHLAQRKTTVSFQKAKRNFLVASLTAPNTISNMFEAPCVMLMQMYAPLYIGLLTNNATFRLDLMKYTFNYLLQNIPQNLSQVSSVMLLNLAEVMMMNIYGKFCHQIRHYSGILSTNYMFYQEWQIFKRTILCYLYPILFIFGALSNATALCCSIYHLKYGPHITSYRDLAFISCVDLIHVTILTVPSSLKCWLPYAFSIHSTWFCSGQAYMRGVLHMTSAWSVALMGLNLLTCQIWSNSSHINQLRVGIAKYGTFLTLALMLNYFKFHSILLVNRAGLFLMCYRVVAHGINPFQAYIFYKNRGGRVTVFYLLV